MKSLGEHLSRMYMRMVLLILSLLAILVFGILVPTEWVLTLAGFTVNCVYAGFLVLVMYALDYDRNHDEVRTIKEEIETIVDRGKN